MQSVGQVQVVFSVKEKPNAQEAVEREKTKILMTNQLDLSKGQIVELYDLRWQIELFFKELKSTFGVHQCGYRNFSAVESWVECCLLTYLYLEWYRAKQLQRHLSQDAKKWWCHQRSHGLSRGVIQVAEREELKQLAAWTETPSGLKRLKKLIRAAHPKEYQICT